MKISLSKPNWKYITLGIAFVFAIFFWNCLPSPLFQKANSLVVTAANGELLGAKIAKDGQWRFPTTDSLPHAYKQCVLQFEDKRFYSHWGVDFLAFARAMWLNLKAARVVSGGSTISMQVVRLSRDNPPRTYREKLHELFLAFRLETKFSKDEILNLYASNAPYGGNIVGIETAAYRYFGIGLHQLTWAEYATLAVLPNSPGLIHPGRNRNELRTKRNKLLARLKDKNIIDHETYVLAIDEELPNRPQPFPKLAPHLVDRIKSEIPNAKKKQQTTISISLQQKINTIVKRHQHVLQRNQVHNLAVLVLDTKTKEVKAYVGNHYDLQDKTNGFQVNIITSPRSTGSILKPFLYAAMLSEGDLLPNSLVKDVPTFIGSFAPKNYNLSYDGAVPANKALARSLNIPAVRMLMDYSVPKFYDKLKKIGISTLNQPSNHYGLSLILGGAEGSLWDICGTYASMANNLLYYEKNSGKYPANNFTSASYYPQKQKEIEEKESAPLGAAATWFTFEAMLDVERPGVDNNWREFSSSQKIAWKTGTSFGYRDAWAVGVTPEYVVGVWVGNADGEGRPGIVGVRAAAPVLFEVFDLLPNTTAWFPKPHDDIQQGAICQRTGFLASQHCETVIQQDIPSVGERFNTCPYHQTVHLNKEETLRVNEMCETTENIVHRKWFVLPPMMEWFYKSKNADYKTLPPFKKGCQKDQQGTMQIIYPQQYTQIFLPRGLDSKRQKTVFEVAHRDPTLEIYWYIDEKYVGKTKQFHQLAIQPTRGKHTLTITDAKGNQVKATFEVLERTE